MECWKFKVTKINIETPLANSKHDFVVNYSILITNNELNPSFLKNPIF